MPIVRRSRHNLMTQDADNDYQETGVVGPISVLSPEEARDSLKAFNEWRDTLEQRKVSGNLRFKPHLFLPFARHIAFHPTLIGAVKAALQSENILLWSSDFNVKDRGSGGYFSPHQDATYAGLEPASRCLTAWVALSDPVSEREGCLSFWKGSHRLGQLPHIEDSSSANNMLSRGQSVSANTAAADWTSIPLAGGQATLHHFHTVHRSGPNRSKASRVGLALRYAVPCVKQTGRTRECVTLASGRTEHGLFDLEPVLPPNPTASDIVIGKEAHAEAIRREVANYFHSSQATTYDQK